MRKCKTKKFTNIYLLPDEILLYIISYLDLTSLLKLLFVCRRFREIAKDESLYIRYNYSSYVEALEHEWLKNITFYQNADNFVTALRKNDCPISLYILGNAGQIQKHLWNYLEETSSIAFFDCNPKSYKFKIVLRNQPFKIENTIDIYKNDPEIDPLQEICIDTIVGKYKIIFMLAQNNAKLKEYLCQIKEYIDQTTIICAATSNASEVNFIPSNIIILDLKNAPEYLKKTYENEQRMRCNCGYRYANKLILDGIIKKILAITQKKLFQTIYLILNKSGKSISLMINDNFKLRHIQKTDYIYPLLKKIKATKSYKCTLQQLKIIKKDKHCIENIRFFHVNNNKCKNNKNNVESNNNIPSNLHEESIKDMISFVKKQSLASTVGLNCQFM